MIRELKNLQDWLAWLENYHAKSIDLSLERVIQVANNLQLLPFPKKSIVVGGTNGKGSTVAMLESIYQHAGYRVGSYFSPHLLKFNERIRINGEEVEDQALCLVFQLIYQNLNDITLTYFEYITLAALLLFKQNNVDIAILEVGLGGRLDAVNIIDADCSIVTSISLDHTQWLGNTIEQIGLEKAGIFRNNKPAIYADINPPQSLIKYANQIQANLLCYQKHYRYLVVSNNWQWSNEEYKWKMIDLIFTSEHQAKNAAACCAAIASMKHFLPVTMEALQAGLQHSKLIGRCQPLTINKRNFLLDVAHNVDSVRKLTNFLNCNPILGKNIAVFSMLVDKDIVNVIPEVIDLIDKWYVGRLAVERAAEVSKIIKIIQNTKQSDVVACHTLINALNLAYADTTINDRIIIFGSFYTVSAGVNWLVKEFDINKTEELRDTKWIMRLNRD